MGIFRINIEKVLILSTFIPFYLVSLCWPKRRSLWLFGAWFGKQYSDNSRFLYEWIFENHRETVTVYWITKDKAVLKKMLEQELPAVYAYSLKGLLLQLNAYVFVSTVNSLDFFPPAITVRNYYIQLWHGTAIKAVLAETMRRYTFRYVKFKVKSWLVDNYDFVVSPGRFCDASLMKIFEISHDRLFRSGYPRCDSLFLSDSDLTKLRKEFKVSSNERLWFYLPTHRMEGRNNLSSNRNMALKLIGISDEFEKHNIVLVIKPHYYEADKFVDLMGTRNVQVKLTLSDELYRCLGCSDGLLTDYSSVIFDYDVIKKPIVFFPYDEDVYQRYDRSLRVGVGDLSKYVVRDIESIPGYLGSMDYGSRRGFLKVNANECFDRPYSKRVANELLRRIMAEG